ncbi:MAG TPA: lipid-A-disaccharide synthase [Candidatus Acidoferrales bacterium]|nr:lipid-A-disaccharide synthase [Candidatus Acidoferrales bacterium]
MSVPQILISAGEASSDMYAARLARAVAAKTGAKFFGMGGEKMREQGVEIVADASQIAVVGITEVLHRLPAVWRAWRRLESEAMRRKPALAITVDSPGFNFGLARRLKKHGVRCAYFISPQLWAWRPRRMRWIQERFERVIVIFPFEEEIYRKAGVKVDFVGHPLVDSVHRTMTREQFAAKFGLDARQQILALLPGSRPSEIRRNLPIILEACKRLVENRSLQIVLAAAPGLGAKSFNANKSPDTPVTIVESATYDALAAADCAIVSSGTATVEAALLGTPMVVVYRVSGITALIARPMISTRFFAMVNLIVGRTAIPELIQEKFTAEALRAEVSGLLNSPEAREQQKRDLAQVRDKLGRGGAIERAADVIAEMLRKTGAEATSKLPLVS